ncbi:hypothetical protein LTR74_017288, partial [Friedmanniomyces endolithicus]
SDECLIAVGKTHLDVARTATMNDSGAADMLSAADVSVAFSSDCGTPTAMQSHDGQTLLARPMAFQQSVLRIMIQQLEDGSQSSSAGLNAVAGHAIFREATCSAAGSALAKRLAYARWIACEHHVFPIKEFDAADNPRT